MPMINTRKRKPATTPLDRLLTVSAQELSSPSIPMGNESDVSDAASTHSGDFPLGRIRRTESRRRAEEHGDDREDDVSRVAPPKRQRRLNSEDEVDDVDADAMAQEILRIRALLRRADRTADHHSDVQGSTRLHDEIRRLHATVETLVTRAGLHSEQNAVSLPSTPLETVQYIHSAVRSLQSVIPEPLNAETLAHHTRAPLERLWQQARQSVEHEMHTKLTFWKQKARDLRESLRGAVHTSVRTESPPPLSVVQDALDFVSTFYLLEIASDQSRTKNPFKGMAVAMATDRIFHELRDLESQRCGELSHAQPFASSLLLLSQRAVDASGDGLGSPIYSTTSAFDSVPRGGRIGNEAGPPPDVNVADAGTAMPQRPHVRGGFPPRAMPSHTVVATSTAALLTDNGTGSLVSQSTPLLSTATPPATLHPNRTNCNATLPQLPANGLNQDVRRRLARLVDAQRQLKPPAPSSTQPSAAFTPAEAPTTTVLTLPTALTHHDSPNDSTSQALHAVTVAAPIATSAPSASTSTSSVTAATSSVPPLAAGAGADASSDSDISPSGLGCTACGRNDSYSSLLLCDNGCEREFHTFCLQPPLEKIPEGDWYCPKCLAMENIQHNSRVYACSAALCNKIAGAKYCTLHRCKFDKCLNRGNVGGFCRRHEQYRASKSARRIGGVGETTATPTAFTAAPTRASATVVGSAPVATTTPVLSEATKVSLNTEQLMNNMRQMGIWLPADMKGSTTNKATSTSNPNVK